MKQGQKKNRPRTKAPYKTDIPCLTINQVFELPLLDLIDRLILDWSIQQGTPWSRNMKDSERRDSAFFGLALCRFAMQSGIEEKIRNRLFEAGTRILDRAQYHPFKNEILSLLRDPVVKQRDEWIWHLNRPLLNFDDTADAAVIRSLHLKLPRGERLRDHLVLGVLEGAFRNELPITDACVPAIAAAVLSGEIQFSLAKDRKTAIKAAKDWKSKNANTKAPSRLGK